MTLNTAPTEGEKATKAARWYKNQYPKFLEDLNRHRANELEGVGYAAGLKDADVVSAPVAKHQPAWERTPEDARAMAMARETLDQRLADAPRTISSNCPGCGKLRNLGNNTQCFDCRKALATA